jgi:hypothetical protein
MPNWVTNNVYFNTDEKTFNKIVKFINSKENDFDFNKLIPMPLEEEENWYNWRLNNWNTKWNASDVYIGDDYIEFNTAWSHPCNIIKVLSEKFPSVCMSVKYADEDFGYNVGEYTIKNGDEIDCFFPEGGSEEAYTLAIEVTGDEYHIWDVFFDVGENESIENNSFYKTMVKLSYEKYKDVDLRFPSNVLNMFLTIALENENYELANKIKNK